MDFKLRSNALRSPPGRRGAEPNSPPLSKLKFGLPVLGLATGWLWKIPMRSRLPAVIVCLACLLAGTARAAEEEGGDKKAPEHKITQAKSYLMLDPIYTSIVEDDRPIGMLMIGVGIDVPNEELREVVTRSMPVLRDAYVRNLMAFSAVSVRGNVQPDVTAIASRLQSVTDRALGKKGAKVLLAQVAIRVVSK